MTKQISVVTEIDVTIGRRLRAARLADKPITAERIAAALIMLADLAARAE